MIGNLWATLLLISSVALAVASFCINNDIVEGVLIYIAQCLLFCASVMGIPYLNIVTHNPKSNAKQNN